MIATHLGQPPISDPGFFSQSETNWSKVNATGDREWKGCGAEQRCQRCGPVVLVGDRHGHEAAKFSHLLRSSFLFQANPIVSGF